MKNNEKAPEWEKADPANCTHTGYYVPIGMEVFKIGVAEDLYEVIIGKICLRCGKEFTSKTSMLSLKYIEKIKTPKVPITPPPDIESTPLAQAIKRAYTPRKKKTRGRPRLFKNTKPRRIRPQMY